MSTIIQQKSAVFLTFLIALSITLSGCNLHLIAEYDESTDQAVTALQRKMESFFIDLESKFGNDASKYEHYIDFYKEVKVDISALAFRVNSRPKNDITSKQINALQANIKLMEQLHQTGISSMALISEPRKDFNIALGNILKLELAKKRGAQGE